MSEAVPLGGELTALKCYVDQVTRERVVGWVLDTQNPSVPLTVRLMVDGQEIMRDVARIPRPSLGTLYGCATHGFDFSFPVPLAPDVHHHVSLRLLEGNRIFYDGHIAGEPKRRTGTVAAGGDDAETERQLRAAIALEPASARLRRRLGHLLWTLQRCEEAVEAIEAGIAMEPSEPNQYSTLSHTLSFLGRTEGAIAAMRRAIELGRRDARDHAHLAGLLQQMNDPAGAAVALRQAVELDPHNAALAARLADAVKDSAAKDEGTEALLQFPPAP